MSSEERTDSPAAGGAAAPTVAAVHLDPKTLETIIDGVAARLRESGAEGAMASAGSGGPSTERERRPEQPEDRRSGEVSAATGGGLELKVLGWNGGSCTG